MLTTAGGLPLLCFRMHRGDRIAYAVVCQQHQHDLRADGWTLDFHVIPLPSDACDLCAGLTTDLG